MAITAYIQLLAMMVKLFSPCFYNKKTTFVASNTKITYNEKFTRLSIALALLILLTNME